MRLQRQSAPERQPTGRILIFAFMDIYQFNPFLNPGYIYLSRPVKYPLGKAKTIKRDYLWTIAPFTGVARLKKTSFQMMKCLLLHFHIWPFINS